MNLSALDLRLQSRASLVADLCEELRAGRDPLARLKREMKALVGESEEQDFIAGLYGALHPELRVLWP